MDGLTLAEASGFRSLDWIVLGAYLCLLIFTGVVLSRRKPRSADEYFLAERRMPSWAVAISLLATVQSAATFVGVPEQGYGGDLRYLSTSIGSVLAAIVLVRLFIPVYYRLGVSTPYQLLLTRFGPGARSAAALTYLGGRVMASGARIFIGAVPFCLAVFGDDAPAHLMLTIAGFMVFGILFTFAGGVRSVIWTDVLQVFVYIGSAIAILAVLWFRMPVGAGGLWEALTHPPNGPSKLTVFRLGLDPDSALGIDWRDRFTILTACTGFLLLNLGALGTDQDLVQRTLTCRDSRHASRSIIGGTLIGIPAVLLFSAIGLLLYIFYKRPDIMGQAHIVRGVGSSTDALVDFSLFHMPAGMAGLMIAGMLAAGPAGTNASLNSMASSTIADIYRPRVRNRPDSHYLWAGRAAVVLWGIVLGAFASICVYWQRADGKSLIDFALSVMIFAYAGLVGIFLAALLTRRGSSTSAIAGLITGAAIVLFLQPIVLESLSGTFAWADTLWKFRLAYPWHLCLGAAAAFLVCIAAPARPPGKSP